MTRFLVIRLSIYSKAWHDIPVSMVEDLKTAWDRGYDFTISSSGAACSNRDVEALKADGLEGVIIDAGKGRSIQVRF